MDIEWAYDGADRQALHPAGAARDGAQPRRTHDAALHAQAHVQGDRRGPQHRGAHRRRRARVVRDAAQMALVQAGDVLVADMTDPDWEPVMKRAAAIVTNRGGRTCHAAIIARELGVPAVVGCGNATHTIRDGQEVTVSLRGRRHRIRLRGPARFRADSRSSTTRCRVAGADHDERRQSRSRLRLCRHSPPRRRTGAPGIHHQSHDRRASARAARVRRARRSTLKEPIRAQIAGYSDPVSFFVDRLCRGHRADRRRLRARAGDRAALGLQIERVRQPHRRRAVRAARRKSHARLPRRRRATSTRPSGPASNWSAARYGACARRWDSATCRSWCRSCARWRRRAR